jgi:hypothetical protein
VRHLCRVRVYILGWVGGMKGALESVVVDCGVVPPTAQAHLHSEEEGQRCKEDALQHEDEEEELVILVVVSEVPGKEQDLLEAPNAC